jgi:hypothetical protein
MNRVYNQANTTLTVDGVLIQDFAEGTSLTLTLEGGEVQKTQGTDGAGINIATNQGATVKFTLRETSRSISFLNALRLLQEKSSEGCTVIFRTGADICFSMTDAFISRPGELSTGDKTQGTMEFTLTSASDNLSNL